MTPKQQQALLRARNVARGKDESPLTRLETKTLLQVADSAVAEWESTATEPIKCVSDATRQLYYLRGLDCEEMWALALNSQLECIERIQLSIGGLAGCSLKPADIFRTLLNVSGCSAFVLAHNHPSGCSEPSREDIEMTAKIVRLGNQLGLPLLDHIVIAREGSRGIVSEGLTDGL